MSPSLRRRGNAAAVLTGALTAVLSCLTILGHLRGGTMPPPAPEPFTASGALVRMDVAGSRLEAGAARLDPFLRQPHVLEDVSISSPSYTLSGNSASMIPEENALVFTGASLAAGDLSGTADTLTLAGSRIVFEGLEAEGGVAPLWIQRFRARRAFLPTDALKRRGAGGVEQLVESSTLGDHIHNGSQAALRRIAVRLRPCAPLLRRAVPSVRA